LITAAKSSSIPVRLPPYPLLQVRAIFDGKLAITPNDAAALQCPPLRLQQLFIAKLVTEDSKLQRNNRALSDENEVLKRRMETLRQQIQEVENRLLQELAVSEDNLRKKKAECEHERVGKNRAEERLRVLEGFMRAVRGNLVQVDNPSVSTPVVVIDDDADEDDEEELDAPKPPKKRKRERAC
jgi:predicted RNase H-like nuclease (RuvC/YqgF family)